jgi:hypothetical protein
VAAAKRQLKVYGEPATVFVHLARNRLAIARGIQQCNPQIACVLCRQTKQRREHPRLVSPARMPEIQTVVPELFDVDYGVVTVGKLQCIPAHAAKDQCRFSNASNP